MPATVQFARLDRVAVGQQYRARRLVRLDAHVIGGHHVRPVDRTIGNAPEALRLALGAEHAVGSQRILTSG
jgi:predicted acetyltransferase